MFRDCDIAGCENQTGDMGTHPNRASFIARVFQNLPAPPKQYGVFDVFRDFQRFFQLENLGSHLAMCPDDRFYRKVNKFFQKFGKCDPCLWRKSRGNRVWFELARVRVTGSQLYIRPKNHQSMQFPIYNLKLPEQLIHFYKRVPQGTIYMYNNNNNKFYWKLENNWLHYFPTRK